MSTYANWDEHLGEMLFIFAVASGIQRDTNHFNHTSLLTHTACQAAQIDYCERCLTLHEELVTDSVVIDQAGFLACKYMHRKRQMPVHSDS